MHVEIYRKIVINLFVDFLGENRMEKEITLCHLKPELVDVKSMDQMSIFLLYKFHNLDNSGP